MASQFVQLPISGSGGGGSGVTSFNSRIGAVLPLAGDYNAGQVTNTPSGNISSTNVQTAINELDTEKQAVITGAATTITTSNLTANRAVVSDGSGKVAVSTVTDTELGYVSGVTSSIQTQLNGKEPTISTLPIAKGGTNSSTALNNNRIMQSSGGAIVEAAAITASRALVSNASGIPVAATTTSTEIGFVNGVTSAIQTQLNNKQPLDSDLTAVAGLATTGLIARTGSGTAATRTVTGTSGNITVTNGDGVSGNPTIDLNNSGVVAGTYTYSTVTVDAKGRVTAAVSGTPTTPFSPQTEWILREDCTPNTTGASGSALTFGNTGTASTIITGSTVGVDSTQHALGVFEFRSGTAINSRSYFYLADTAMSNDGGWTLDAQFRIALSAFATVADPYTANFGFGDATTNTTSTPTDGAYFSYVGDGVNTTWFCNTVQGGVTTTTNSGVLVTPGLYQYFQVTLTASSALFYINNSLVATISTNLPGTAQWFGLEGKVRKAANGTAANYSMYVDYIYGHGTRATAR